MLGNYIHEWSEVWHVSGKHVWISWTAAWDLKISDLDIPEHLLNSRAHKNSNGLGAGNNIFEYVWMLVKPLDNQVKRALLQPFDCSCLFRLHFILEDGSITNGGIFEVYAQMWCLSYTSPDIHKSKCHTQIHGRLKWLLWVSKKTYNIRGRLMKSGRNLPCFVEILPPASTVGASENSRIFRRSLDEKRW